MIRHLLYPYRITRLEDRSQLILMLRFAPYMLLQKFFKRLQVSLTFVLNAVLIFLTIKSKYRVTPAHNQPFSLVIIHIHCGDEDVWLRRTGQ